MHNTRQTRRKTRKGRLGDNKMKIKKLPSGNYNARVEIPTADGKRRWKSITAPDRATVRKLASEYEQKAKHGAPTTLSEALTRYLSAKKAVLSPYTIKGYQNIIEKVNAANLGDIYADMSRPDAQKIVTAFAGLSQKTIRNRMGLISAAVRFAGYNMPPVTYPQKKKAETHIPTEDEMQKVMEAAAGTELEIPIALGMMGLRRGEICALKLSDIDDTTVHIHAAAVDIGGKITVKSPKTYDSDRYVTIPDALAYKIRKQGYVTKLTPEELSYHFISFLKKQDVQHFRFHDLRHFFASYCHNVLKLSDAQIQRLGGWKTDHVMKRVYIDSMRDDDAANSAAAGIASFLR